MNISETHKLNPIDWINCFWPDVKIGHITYDPEMTKGDYNIRRGSKHDGTMLFTYQNVWEVLSPIVEGVSFCKGQPPPVKASMCYKVGPIIVVTVFGKMDLPVGRRSGQDEIMSMPVIATWGETA